MMGHKEKMINGYEVDALTKMKRKYIWRPGVRRHIKKCINRRIRQDAKIDEKVTD